MDEIQRKLQLFEKRLAGRWAYHDQVLNSAPLFFAAIGLILGISLQEYFEISLRIWLILLSIFFFAAVSYSLVYRKGRIKPAVLAYMAMVCAVCLGAVRLAGYNHARSHDIRNFVGQERVLATIRGNIVTEPYTRYREDWAFAKFTHSDPSSSFYMQLTEVEAVDGWAKVCGSIRVVVDEPLLDLKAGDCIEVYCWLSRFRGATNPGQFDLADYLGKRNVYISASVKSRQGIKLLQTNDTGMWIELKDRFREIVSRALLDEGLIAEREKGLLEALLLGYRGNIDADTYRAFERTGLLHFISLSGMHLGILVGLVWWLCARAGRLKRGRALVCIVVVMLFLVVVPPRAPTIRAALICFIFFLSVFFRRHSNPLNSLSIAAIILLLVWPTNLFEVGWQLSFASVLGILFFAGGINSFLHAKIIKPVSALIGNRWPGRVVSRGLSYAITIFGVGLSAWLGGAGILLYHFYSINPLTSVWTVVAFPLVACILGVGFLKIVIWFVFPSIAALMGVLLSFLSVALIEVVEFLSRINFCEILVGQVPIGVVLLYYSGIAAIAWAWYLRPFARKITIASVAIVVLGTIGFIKLHRVYPSDLQMICLDVGHGQAVVMQSGVKTFLFDAGSQYNRNIGQRVIIPFLRSRGISRVDGIIISHDDIDHINGIVETAENCKVTSVYASAAFVGKSKEYGTAKYLADCLAKEDIELKQLGGRLELGSKTSIEILWPDEAACKDESLGDNDKSVVSLIEFAGRRILLCADIERFAQEQITEHYDKLRSDVVVVPHHGSTRTGYSAFVNGLGAEYLICSCGRRYFERLQRASSSAEKKWYYTTRDGAIFVCIDGDGDIKIRTFNEK